MKPTSPLLLVSLLVAAVCFAQPFFAWSGTSTATKELRTFAPAALWVVLLFLGLIVHGKRGLWLLVGAPFALLWPLAWGFLYLACDWRLFPGIECP
jgi:hypothetical protein